MSQLPSSDGSDNVLQRKGSWLRTVKAVAWSFIGLRQGSEFQEDTQKLNPLHIMVVAIAGAGLFVAGLIFFVRWAVVAAR